MASLFLNNNLASTFDSVLALANISVLAGAIVFDANKAPNQYYFDKLC